MKIKEITFSLSQTIPHPQNRYENYKPMTSVTAELGNKDPIEALHQLQSFVKTEMKRYITTHILNR